MKVVFLDRDGTLIKDPPDERVDKEEKIELFPDSIDALRYLTDNEYSIIIITNQAGISEKRISVKDFERIHAKVLELLSPSGANILKTYMCPHSPADTCECRKPKPEMLLNALRDFNINPDDVYMIGDRESDVLAGIRAGVRTILVETGTTPVHTQLASHRSPTLLDAVKYAVTH